MNMNKNNILIKPSIKGNKNNIYYEIFGHMANDTPMFNYYNKPVVYSKLKHSICLNMIYDYEYKETYLLGDGLFTNKKNLYLTVDVRDCMGVIIIGKDFCGVVHISWKNLYLGIIENIFNLLKKESINISLLDFIVTPHISIDSMEVNENFVNLWKDHEFYKAYLSNPEVLKSQEGKFYFSIYEVFKKNLMDIYKVKKENIYKIPINTFTNEEYSSFRRDGVKDSNINRVVVYIK